VTGFGLTLGASLLFRFQSSKSTTGVYTVTDTGADDPGGRPAVFTRRADFDASGDFSTGLAVLDQEEGKLYRLAVPGGFSLDSGDVVFTPVQAILLPEGVPAGTAVLSDGGGGTRTTSAEVSAALVANDAAAARAALSPPRLITSATATITDASPAGDGSAAIDGDGVITLSAEDALAGGFAAGPKISLPLSGDAGTRFRARVRLISKSGPSSDSLLALYFVGAAGLAIYARISGQIGVWDLGASVLATASVSALWDGSEYLEIRMVDGYLSFGVWQGTTYTPLYLTTTTVRPTSVGVMFGHVAGGATQTVTLDGFTVTDLRAW